MPEGIEYDDESTPYKDLLKKIWHDIRRYRPTTPLQHTAFVLHLCMLIAVVGPRIIAWGHITRLHGIRYNVTNDLLPTVLLIGIELITASYCLALVLITCKLYQDRASVRGYSHVALFRLVAYLILIVVLESVMAAVLRFRWYGAFVVPVPYYICFWVSIAIFVIGSTFFLERKRSAIRI